MSDFFDASPTSRRHAPPQRRTGNRSGNRSRKAAPSARPKPTRRRRVRAASTGVRRWTAAGVAGCALAGFGLWLAAPGTPTPSPEHPAYAHAPSGVLGDLDGDGVLSPAERDDLTATQHSVAALARTAFAAKGVSTRLVAPAGQDWWTLVSSQAPSMDLSYLVAPAGVRWYAVTTGRAYRPLADHLSQYQAVHIKFDSDEAALRWTADRFDRAEGSFNSTLRGDGLLTLTPLWVDGRREPFSDVADLPDVDIRIGLWQIDLDEAIATGAAEAADERRYRALWRHLGFGGTDISWVATSADPDAPWVGRLDGFAADQVDVDAALSDVNTFGIDCTDSGPRCLAAASAADAIQEVFARSATFAGGGEPGLHADQAPTDAEVYFARSPSFDALAAGQRGYFYPAVAYTAWWVTPEKTTEQAAGTRAADGYEMTVLPVFDGQ